jgi:hypothetical protein
MKIKSLVDEERADCPFVVSGKASNELFLIFVFGFLTGFFPCLFGWEYTFWEFWPYLDFGFFALAFLFVSLLWIRGCLQNKILLKTLYAFIAPFSMLVIAGCMALSAVGTTAYYPDGKGGGVIEMNMIYVFCLFLPLVIIDVVLNYYIFMKSFAEHRKKGIRGR